MAEEIPKELEILNPELQVKPILVGKKVYKLYPLTEGQVEKLSKFISDILYEVYTLDRECPKCHVVHRDAADPEKLLNKCPICDESLFDLKKPISEVILAEGRIKRILTTVIGIIETDVRNATLPQLKYIAGLLYAQNFDDEKTAPEDSSKNFTGLLDWLGIGAAEDSASPLEQSMKLSPTNMDLPESTSKENGETES